MYKAANLIKQCSNDFRDAFLKSIDVSREEIEIDSNYNINKLDKYLNSLTQFKPVILSTMVKAANQTEKPKETIQLNIDKEITLKESERLSTQLITGLNSSQSESIKNIIQEGLEKDLSYKTISKKLKSQIGLNAPQIKTLESIENHLIESGTSRFQIEKIINLKSKQMLKLRADTIALTESARAVSSGRYLIQQQMYLDNDIKQNSKQEWLTGSDERVCQICGPMNGQKVGMNEDFTAGNGSKVTYPILHPRCGCIVIVHF